MSQSLFPTVPLALACRGIATCGGAIVFTCAPCKEQVVPFTVSPRLLHSPFLYPTGKRSSGCGNVLALRS